MTTIEYLKKTAKKYLIEEKTSFSFFVAILCYVVVSGFFMITLPAVLQLLMEMNNLSFSIFPPTLMVFYGHTGGLYAVLLGFMVVAWLVDIKYPFLQKIRTHKSPYYQIGAGFVAGIGFVILGFIIWVALDLYGVI